MLAHVQDDVVRPRRTWEQQQMKTVVPITACSAKYGRAAAPRAAPICPGETLAAGRAVSGHSHGETAAFEAIATCPSVRVFADCCFMLAQVLLQQLQGLLPVLVICQQRMVGLLPTAQLRSSFRRL